MSDLRHFTVRWPLGVEAAALRAFFAGLAALPGPSWPRLVSTAFVAIETRSTPTGIAHTLSLPSRWAAVVQDHLRAAVAVRLTETERQPLPLTVGVELALMRGRDSLRTDQPEATVAALLTSLEVKAGQALVVQWLATPAATDDGSAWLRRVGLAPADNGARRPWVAETPSLLVVARLGALAADARTASALVRRPLAVLRGVRRDGTQLRPRALPSSWAVRRLQAQTRPVVWPGIITAQELAAVSGLPVGSPVVPGLRLGTAPVLPPAVEIPHRGRVLLRANYPGSERPIAMSSAGALGHLLLLGGTGAGKSTTLLSVARSDMEQGHGVVVIDPKGDLARDVLAAVPRARLDDVIYLDPSDDRPVGFQPLDAPPERLDLAVDWLIRWFRFRFGANFGPRSEDTLRHALTALADAHMTLAELPLMLSDQQFLAGVLRHVTDISAQTYWAWWQSLSGPHRAEIAAAPLNKVRSLLRPRLRAVLAQTGPGWSVEQVLAQRKILVVSLGKGQIGEDAAGLLGSLVLSRLWTATLDRAALPPSQRHAAFVLVDELADLLGGETSFGDALAQSRGLSVGWALATQHLGQLPPALRHDVLTNCRSHLTFRLAADDAAVMAREFGPYLAAGDLQALGGFEAATRLWNGAATAPPCTGVTIPPSPPAAGWAETVRERSRQRYGRDRADMEAELAARRRPGSPPAAPGRRRRAS